MIRNPTELLLSLRLKPCFVGIPFHFLWQILDAKSKTGMSIKVDPTAHFSNAVVFFFPQIIENLTPYHNTTLPIGDL